ncbi:trypsin-1 [Folsomia candida]|uniref:trypsin-1 n=1 Tax=Folsomia candida TaxID=158441 RepID=UPI0016053AC8|nr:trypsin-1 [Folsomia candida]XP_035707946.1 trypsin-1 [Folsomia candida]
MKSATIIFLGVVALASAMPKLDTALFQAADPRLIVGGVEATKNEFPFMIDLRVGGRHNCGGSIVSPDWVVTAAHCVGGSPSSYTLVAGDHNLTLNEGTEQSRSVTAIVIHPGYNRPTIINNDIALMRVDRPFEFNEFVGPAVIPQLNFVPTALATVAGWGMLSFPIGDLPDVLMKVEVPHVADAPCRTANIGVGVVTESMVCYGVVGKDSCKADSGGPLMCGSDNALCGIVSWGKDCALDGYPGVYTETSYFAEWIRSTIAA